MGCPFTGGPAFVNGFVPRKNPGEQRGIIIPIAIYGSTSGIDTEMVVHTNFIVYCLLRVATVWSN